MPARGTRQPVDVVGVPSLEALDAGLSLLALFGDKKAMAHATRTLEGIKSAAKANAEAVAAFGPINKIEGLQAEAEADREAAAKALSDAQAEAERREGEAHELIKSGRERLDADRAQLTADTDALAGRVAEQDERERKFNEETAGLRRALKE